MTRLAKWHKELLSNMADRLGLSAYQIIWIAFAKGAIIGSLIGAYYL